MHKKNIFRNKPPDFKQLIQKYPNLRNLASILLESDSGETRNTIPPQTFNLDDSKNKILVKLDLSDSDCLRTLSQVLLVEHFNLKVEIPRDRLIPTVPLRLNYLCWLDEIFDSTVTHSPLRGIDIGTGATAIYPLLGARSFGWRFLAIDADSQSVDTAKANVARNNLADQIDVRLVESNDAPVLFNVLSSPDLADTDFDFCMCNPPFFDTPSMEGSACSPASSEPLSEEQQENLSTLWDEEDSDEDLNLSHPSDYSAVSTALLNEESKTLLVRCTAINNSGNRSGREMDREFIGGEEQFVEQHLIAASAQLERQRHNRVRLYSAMLGRKSSVGPLRRALVQRYSVPARQVSVYELCQGHKIRWGLAWTFDASLCEHFPLSEFRLARLERRRRTRETRAAEQLRSRTQPATYCQLVSLIGNASARSRYRLDRALVRDPQNGLEADFSEYAINQHRVNRHVWRLEPHKTSTNQSLDSLFARMQQSLSKLSIPFLVRPPEALPATQTRSESIFSRVLFFSAPVPTWQHSRRKRRLMERESPGLASLPLPIEPNSTASALTEKSNPSNAALAGFLVVSSTDAPGMLHEKFCQLLNVKYTYIRYFEILLYDNIPEYCII